MTVEQGIGDSNIEKFPIVMRVLAVDDDPTCLLLLETLLRRCQYNVTTTSQATTALRMLRENKNKFDLVISDVHMPDMDGFKLLELVGLEMDLPVIMLSANGDPKLVMKGITHGACYYLLKPVRIEELKTIWQHLIRRKKNDNKDRNSLDNRDKPDQGSSEAVPDQKLNKKRKDQNGDEDSRVKPHFCYEAVPKNILELMNAEKLTRENVASHLQAYILTSPGIIENEPIFFIHESNYTVKYRLYLKRISTVANQQANRVAALGSSDASYLQINSMSRLGLHNLAGSVQFHSTPFRSLPSSGMLDRLNLLQGMPVALELDQIQSNKGVNYIPELPTHPGDTASFPVSSGFSDLKIIAGSSNSPFVGSLNPRYSSNFPDHGRCNDNWSNAVQSNGVQSNSLTLNDCFKRSILHPSGIRESMSTMALQSRNNPCDVSSISTLPIHLQDSKADLPCQVGVATVSSNAGQLIKNGPLGWDDHRQDDPYHSNGLSNSINSAIPINGNGNPNGCNSLFFQRTTSFSSTGLSNFVDTSLMKHN
uniref:Response regulatory domain-containing protein n=1 Tax=Salix viminalis TaxID=40686 RepID=A0A6N2K7P0_SALVM